MKPKEPPNPEDVKRILQKMREDDSPTATYALSISKTIIDAPRRKAGRDKQIDQAKARASARVETYEKRLRENRNKKAALLDCSIKDDLSESQIYKACQHGRCPGGTTIPNELKQRRCPKRTAQFNSKRIRAFPYGIRDCVS